MKEHRGNAFSALKAVLMVAFATAALSAGIVMMRGPLSTSRQIVGSLVAGMLASLLTRKLTAGITAIATAVLVFTQVAPHLPWVGQDWPY